ncbi:MAG: aldo/keto reductase, partial [Candidatus Omnitrophica bacterium CG11_big_fil_rev_8_21_14_0_20_64_10]
FNVFRQNPIEDLFPRAKEKGVSLIVRLPLASGLLSGKFNADTTFPVNDHRNYNANGQKFNVGETFSGIPFPEGVRFASKIRGMVPKGMTPAQLALRWVLDFDAVTVAIPGATAPGQVGMNLGASTLAPLPRELHDRLRLLYEAEIRPLIRGKY